MTDAPLSNLQVGQNYTPRRRQDDEGAALTIAWNLSSAYTLTSITSRDEGSLFNPEGTDGAAIDIFKIPYIGKTRQFAQDLRVTSNLHGPLNFIAGAYYQRAVVFNSPENQFYNFLDYNGNGVINYRGCADSSFNTPGSGHAAGIFINATCGYYNQFDQIKNRWTLYSDGSRALSRKFKLHLGARYNHDIGIQKNALGQLRGPDEVPIVNILAKRAAHLRDHERRLGRLVDAVGRPAPALRPVVRGAAISRTPAAAGDIAAHVRAAEPARGPALAERPLGSRPVEQQRERQILPDERSRPAGPRLRLSPPGRAETLRDGRGVQVPS